MPQGSLKLILSTVAQPLANFLHDAAICDGTGVPSPVPLSYLSWLYESWRRFHGIDDVYRIVNQRTFTYFLTHMPLTDLPALYPLAAFTVGYSGVRCVKLALKPSALINGITNPPPEDVLRQLSFVAKYRVRVAHRLNKKKK